MIEPELIQKVLAIHFDPEHGTPYWLEQQEKLHLDVCRKIRTCDDLHLLGVMDIHQVRTRPITDFIPASLIHRLPEMVLSETGGTTGPPCRRVFTPEEFDQAFVVPWLRAVKLRRFPMRGRWLFVGPGGPHVIAQAARKMARATGSLEPFSVDCDVRWIRRQEKKSMGFTLYLDHVLSQAMNIIACQQINVLFTTPVLLKALARQMNRQQRQRIHGIHTGGMAQDSSLTMELRAAFPKAVILPGYGNSLFGVTFELEEPAADKESVFSVDDPALWLQLTTIKEDGSVDLDTCLGPDVKGRVILHRFDPSFLLINFVERDCACYVAGSGGRKLYNVQSLERPTHKQSTTVY